MSKDTDELEGRELCALDEEDIGAIAQAAGLLLEGAELPEPMLQFALAVAERCASVVDRYGNDEGNAGEEIRALFGIG